MRSVGTTSGPLGASSDVFVTGASGVAALDTPQLSQTKLEIRGIVAEIAELSATQLPQTEFLSAVLPRLCNAMGATAAALWQINVERHSDLVGHHCLPASLMPTADEDAHSPELVNHAKILGCIAAEGAAVLVPPKSIRMAADRPANPLDECLLVVPIKIDDRFEMLLEVIQPASGGPAAQRGYLRFVAQMADLMSDYLRRDRLRLYAREAAYVKTLQASLLSITAATDPIKKLHQTAFSLSQLLDAELVMIAKRRRIAGWPLGYRIYAVSNVPSFDTRSEVVMIAQNLLAARSDSGLLAASRFRVVSSEELTSEELTSEQLTGVQSVDHGKRSAHARCAQSLRELLGCSHLVQLRLDDAGECQALMAFDHACELATVRQRADELVGTLQSLILLSPGMPTRTTKSSTLAAPATITWRPRALRLLVRSSIVLLVLAVAFFPAPDNISAVAVLEPERKELYYAPSAATIDAVHVSTHQAVKKGDPLITLVDNQLLSHFDELVGKRKSISDQLRKDEIVNKQGRQSTGDEQQLVSRIDQAKEELMAIDRQLNIVQSQMDQLTIVARCNAMVTSWDVRNQLLGRPVSAGQLLVTTHQPNEPWQLRLSIPERQLGRLRDAMATSREGLLVQFSLTSHPSEVRQGRLIKVSDQLIKDDEGVARAMGIVAIDGHSLPAKSDGAVARATIGCGRTYAGWLAIRDAYRAASAWWRLNW